MLSVLGLHLTPTRLQLLAAFAVSHRLSEADAKARDEAARYVRGQDLLTSVRAQVLMASVTVRDAMLAPTPGASTGERDEVVRIYADITRALESYQPLLDVPENRQHIQQLHAEIEAFRIASLDILSTDRETWRRDAATLLRRVLPKREVVLAVSDRLQAVNRSIYVAQRQESARMQASVRRRGGGTRRGRLKVA